MTDTILIPSSLREQSRLAAEMAAKHFNIELEEIGIPLSVQESDYDESHYQESEKLYKPPHPDLAKAMFQQLKDYDNSYSDKVIAHLMGATTDRTVRRWRSGEVEVPFTAWRKFLVATGRAPIALPIIIGKFN